MRHFPSYTHSEISDAFKKSLNSTFSETFRKNLSDVFAKEFYEQIREKINPDEEDIQSIVLNILDVTGYDSMSSDWRCHQDEWEDLTLKHILSVVGHVSQHTNHADAT